MAKLNQEALIAALTLSLGEEAIADLNLDEETLASFIVQDDDDDDDSNDDDDNEGDDDDDDEGDDDDNDDDDSGDDDDDDDNGGLEDIDVDKLTAGERILYDTLMKERKRSKNEAMNVLISTSGVGLKHKDVLKRMAKTGVGIKAIKETIEDFREVENASTRILGKRKIVPKSKVKTNILKKKSTAPKLGSKEYGKLLAAKRK